VPHTLPDMAPGAKDGGDQAAAIAFLSDPANWSPRPARVERIETHGALVFLAGDLVLKMKRAVGFDWMDFSTVAKRDAATAAEVELNRRTAPSIYLGQRWITREADGRLALDGAGERVEPLVAMRRFPQSALFDRLAAEGKLTVNVIERLADTVAGFHTAAAPKPEAGGVDLHRKVIETAYDSLVANGGFLDRAEIDRLHEQLLAALDAVAPLLDQRRREGRVRHCHGDLHLRNIVLLDGEPVPFDCIEFNPAFAEIDVLYDLAFLIMDLVHQGLAALGNVVLSRYLAVTGDLGGLPALPLFLATRAAIRAYVAAIAAGSVTEPAAAEAQRAEARASLDRALEFLRPPCPRLVAIGGLSGTGKTTLARALAPRVYAELRTRAAAVLAAGRAVVVDAVHAKPEERAAIAAVATQAGCRFDGLWLEAPRTTLAERIAARRGDASDATVAVLDQQLQYDIGEIDWRRVATGGETANIVDNLVGPLNLTSG
jgi:aminoglycoside phosphotransferase family enzyme/predicted kinase